VPYIQVQEQERGHDAQGGCANQDFGEAGAV